MTSEELSRISLAWLISTRRAARFTQSDIVEPIEMPNGDTIPLTFSLLDQPSVKSEGFLTSNPDGYALGTTGCSFARLDDMVLFFHDLFEEAEDEMEETEEAETDEETSEPENDEQRGERTMRSDYTAFEPAAEETSRLNPDALEAALNSVVIGQEKAVSAVVRAVTVQDAMVEPERPGVLLLTGKPGVGKTFLATEIVKVIEKARPDDPYGQLKIDGATLVDEMGAARLVGASAGFTGYDDEPFFAPILSRPKTIVVVDEAEKIGKAAQQVFLSILEGSLTLNKPINGTSAVDFRRCVFIFTSNAVCDLRNRRTDRSLSSLLAERRELRLALRSSFSDALLSRIGDAVLMNAMNPENIGEVVKSELARSARAFGLEIDFVQATVIHDIIQAADVQTFGIRDIGTIIRMMIAPKFAALPRMTRVVSLYGTLSDLMVSTATNEEDSRRAG